MRINITSNTENTWGLSKDVKILQAALTGHTITVSHWQKVTYAGKHHVNIMLELFAPRHMRNANRNVIIPNPEWFMTPWLERMKQRTFDVWTKTDDGTDIFTKLGLPVQKVGFTSLDRWRDVPFAARRPEFLHLAGNSLLKNTVKIAMVWSQHPKWPKLHIYTSNPTLISWLTPLKARNIKLITEHVPEQEIIMAQNEYLFSVQPSEAEGYGHCIVEPLSAGAIVVSTDGPPMNEFPIVKCAAHPVGKHWYGTRYGLSDLESCIESVLKLSEDELKQMHANNRRWWRANDATFKTRIRALVETIPT